MAFFQKLMNHMLNQVRVYWFSGSKAAVGVVGALSRARAAAHPPLALALARKTKQKQVLVETLANSRVFQRFAVWSHRTSKELTAKS